MGQLLYGLPLLIEMPTVYPQSFGFWFQPSVGAPLPQSFVLLLVRPQKTQCSESRASQSDPTASGLISQDMSRPHQVRTSKSICWWQISRVTFRLWGGSQIIHHKSILNDLNSMMCWFFRRQRSYNILRLLDLLAYGSKQPTSQKQSKSMSLKLKTAKFGVLGTSHQFKQSLTWGQSAVVTGCQLLAHTLMPTSSSASLLLSSSSRASRMHAQTAAFHCKIKETDSRKDRKICQQQILQKTCSA